MCFVASQIRQSKENAMSDYSAMSDFEINKAVALLTGIKERDINEADRLIHRRFQLPNMRFYAFFEPCSNPADAWPIIMANKISLMFDRSLEDGCNAEWCLASSPCDQIIVDHVMPDKILRAAMIVFLMMKESIHAKTSE
jgi:hypothetical protein